MLDRTLTLLRDHVPGVCRVQRLPRQLLGISPFAGEIRPTRVPLFSPRRGRPSWPFSILRDRSLADRNGEARMVVIRPERPGDAAAIHAVHAGSFPTAAEARLVDLLRAAGRLSVSLVAELDGVVVGHVAFSPVATASGVAGAGLAPVAVAGPHRRQGIAARLIRDGLKSCRRMGFGWVVVLGEPEYYRRFGFRPAAEVGLSDEYGGGPAFQVIELIPGHLPPRAGLVRYAPEFASLA